MEALPPAHQEQQPHTALEALGITLRGERDGNLLEAMVPIDAIQTEDVPVDAAHVGELETSMRSQAAQTQGTGQLSPVLLAHVAGLDRLPIIDGFHRTQALRNCGASSVFATIRTGSTPEDVLDLRILAATSHRAVKFARIAEWAEAVWQETAWAKELGITAMQGFSFGFNRRMSGANLGLTPSQVAEIRVWLTQKGEQWQTTPGTIYNYLSAAHAAAPELVREAREGGGRSGLDFLTPLHVREIAKELPGEACYAFQHLVAEAVRAARLTSPQARTLASLIKDAPSLKKAMRIVEAVINRGVEPQRGQSKGRPGTEVAIEATIHASEVDLLLDTILQDELEIAIMSIEYALLVRNADLATKKELFRKIIASAHPAVGAFVRQNRNRELGSGETNGNPNNTPPDRRLEAVRLVLPELDKLQRRALVLSALFRLPLQAIARFTYENEAAVQQALDEARAQLDAQARSLKAPEPDSDS